MARIYISRSGQTTFGTRDWQDDIVGTQGVDVIYGGIAAGDPSDLRDIIWSGAGNDSIFGNGGNDDIRGEDGNDYVKGGAGNDLVEGNTGLDVLYGDAGSDRLFGGEGDDTIYGGSGSGDVLDLADIIDGGAGRDNIFGNGGDDTIRGGLGADILSGGTGRDTFVFSEKWSSYFKNYNEYARSESDSFQLSWNQPLANADIIRGFESGDRINLRGIDSNSLDQTDYYLTLVGSYRHLKTGNDDFDRFVFDLRAPQSTEARGGVYADRIGSDTWIRATNSDFSLKLEGYVGSITADNFIL